MGGSGRGKNRLSLKFQSIIFQLSTYADRKDYWYKISHDKSGAPKMSVFFESPRGMAGRNVKTIVVGSKLFYFPNLWNSNKIFYVNMSPRRNKIEANEWVMSDLVLPTLCNCFIPGVCRHWLYLVGFNTCCSDKDNNRFYCADGRDTSIWGHVYNLEDKSEYSIKSPTSCPTLKPIIVGPWKDNGLVVYIKEDNTLRIHNPAEQGEWRTLVNGLIQDKELVCFTLQLYGDILYTFLCETLVVEAYDIRKCKHLPRVKLDLAKDFPSRHWSPYPLVNPYMFVIANGEFCFTSLMAKRFSYWSFSVDYELSEPTPLLKHSECFPCQYGELRSIVSFDTSFDY